MLFQKSSKVIYSRNLKRLHVAAHKLEPFLKTLLSNELKTVCSVGRAYRVRWRPGQETSLAPQYSIVRSFGSKCTALKKVLTTLSGLFGAPN